MKNLLNAIADKTTENQRDLTRLSEKLNNTVNKEEQTIYITEMLKIFDDMLLFVNFYISNEENIASIIDSRERAVQAYKQITGKDYRGEGINDDE